MKFSRIDFSRLWSTAALAATLTLALAACQGDFANRADAPIPPQTVALMSEKGVDPESPTLIRAYKKESELEIWKMRADGRYVHLKTFPMCRWSGQLGPKTREGDRQVPEGFYSITPAQMNPNSNYYLSFNVGYPNQLDRALGHTGGTIMVHGACSSAGCFSMTDAQIAEIYAIARTSFAGGQRAIQMQSYPFRMTPENLAKHRLDQNMAFWKQLKEGNDHFEVTQKEPRVAFCGRRYVFNAAPGDGQNMDVNAACPTLKHNPEVALAVAEKADEDNRKVAELADSGVKPVRLVYQDGGQHPSFSSRVAEVSRPETLAPPAEIALDEHAAKTANATSQLAAKAPVVSPALAMSAAAHHAAEAPDAVTRALAPDAHRNMSAIAEDVETTGAIKKANAKKSATATAAKKPGATPAH
jgi:murein L,D-transpeptidase YafK